MPLFSPLIIASTVSSWFPTFIGLMGFKRMDRVWRVIGVLFVFMFFMEFLLFYLGYYYKNNIWLSNIVMIIEGIIYLWAMNVWINKSVLRWLFRTILFLFIGFTIFTFLNNPITEDLIGFNLIKGSTLLVLAALTILNRSRLIDKSLISDPVFVFATGILLYNSIGEMIVAINGSSDLLSKSLRMLIWDIQSWINILSNLIYAFAIRCHQQSTRFSS